MVHSVTRKGGKRRSTRKGGTRRQRGGIGSGAATLSFGPFLQTMIRGPAASKSGGKRRGRKTRKSRKSRKGRKRMRGGMGASVSVSLGAYKKLARK
jgi:hypothetical protein